MVAKGAQAALALERHPGLTATFVISYAALTAEQQRLFRWLGAFAPGPHVPEHIVGTLGGSIGK